MHSPTFFKGISKKLSLLTLPYSTSIHPLIKTWRVLRNDLIPTKQYPEHADIVIIGGGFMGSATAYWLNKRAGEGLSVVVLERDLSFRGTNKLFSFDTLSRHFTLPENILLSQYGAEFLRNAKEELGENINIQYVPHEYLLLASEEYAENLEKNVELQREHGIINKLMSIKDLQTKYPWINTTDIKLACISTEKEGVFNSQSLLKGLINKSSDLGTKYIEAEVTGFELELHRDVLMEGVTPGTYKKINNVKYRTSDNEEHSIRFAACVIAAGSNSSNIAKLAAIGSGDGLLKIALPLEKRKYKVYSINDPKTKPKLNTPFIMDSTGLWIRRNSLQNDFICSQLPSLLQNNMSEDEHYNNIFLPSLFNRLPHLKESEINVISEESVDCNTYDDTGIVGSHAYHNNLYFATGFGKYGVQHAPGVGRAIAESIVDGLYSSIDLTRFGFDRFLIDEPMVEFNIY